MCLSLAAPAAAAKPRRTKSREAARPQVRKPPERGQSDEDFAVAAVNDAIADTRENKAKAEDPQATPPQKAAAQAAIEKTEAEVGGRMKEFSGSAKVNEAGERHAAVTGNLELARARAERAVEAARGGQDGASLGAALATRAWIEHGQGDWKAANHDAAEALSLDPANAAAREVFHYTEGAKTIPTEVAPVGQWPIDRQRIEQILGDTPLPAATRDASEVEEWGRRALARQEAIKIVGENFGRLALNDPRAVLRRLDRAQSLAPTLPDVYLQRALAWQALKNDPAAATEAGRAIGLWEAKGRLNEDTRGSLAAGYSLRSTARRALHDDRGALADAERSIAINPASASGYFSRGLAREALLEPRAAILADLKRAAELDARYAARYEERVSRYANEPGATPAAARAERGADEAPRQAGGRSSYEGPAGSPARTKQTSGPNWLLPLAVGAGLVAAMAFLARGRHGGRA